MGDDNVEWRVGVHAHASLNVDIHTASQAFVHTRNVWYAYKLWHVCMTPHVCMIPHVCTGKVGV